MKHNTLPGKAYEAVVAHTLALKRSQRAAIGRLSIPPAIAKQIRRILAAKLATPGEICRELHTSSKGTMHTSPSSIRRYMHRHPALMKRIPSRKGNAQ
ncbi:hypothetical protein XU18_5050 [Perkinsela sp. CCAP 1560/4]|nr:hypothetical protein XU18_5050 [Perkinsela sp. CCAP 1560/4]|eukprot:KNH02908.1 hypothetical protein XU18_5050 [Perkinsela sp. CCAP 1560/4]